MPDPRVSLNELDAVMAVARRGSFRQAAIDLDISTTALSQYHREAGSEPGNAFVQSHHPQRVAD